MIVSCAFFESCIWSAAQCSEIDWPCMFWGGNNAGSPDCQIKGQGLHRRCPQMFALGVSENHE